MASPAVTYTFSNSTTADAGQVNTNFSDLIAGMTDGTKDFSISALTLAGAFTANGNVTLGNATSDTITTTGRLASSLVPGTTNSYDLGSSSLGFAGIYFGANSQTVRIVGSSSMSATWTFTLPVSAGSADQMLVTNGSGVSSWRTGIAGVATNSDAATGYVGEELKQTMTDASAPGFTTNTATNITTSALSLTAGDWDVDAIGIAACGGGDSSSKMILAVSTTSATIPASANTYGVADSTGNIKVQMSWSIPADNRGTLVIPPYRVSLSSTTSFYLVGNVTHTGGTCAVMGTIRARRVR